MPLEPALRHFIRLYVCKCEIAGIYNETGRSGSRRSLQQKKTCRKPIGISANCIRACSLEEHKASPCSCFGRCRSSREVSEITRPHTNIASSISNRVHPRNYISDVECKCVCLQYGCVFRCN